jgi:hypothetical protein
MEGGRHDVAAFTRSPLRPPFTSGHVRDKLPWRQPSSDLNPKRRSTNFSTTPIISRRGQIKPVAACLAKLLLAIPPPPPDSHDLALSKTCPSPLSPPLSPPLRSAHLFKSLGRHTCPISSTTTTTSIVWASTAATTPGLVSELADPPPPIGFDVPRFGLVKTPRCIWRLSMAGSPACAQLLFPPLTLCPLPHGYTSPLRCPGATLVAKLVPQLSGVKGPLRNGQSNIAHIPSSRRRSGLLLGSRGFLGLRT